MQDKEWTEKVIKYCNDHNIPLNHLTDVIRDPKVVPMIRGMAFEFSAMVRLREVLDKDEWFVDKPIINAQLGSGDIDVRIIHRPTHQLINVECKLSGKGSYIDKGSYHRISVKCMRSRTLGSSQVKSLAPKLGVSEEQLSAHADSYMLDDFDIVVTSIANAFYITDEETDRFVFSPTDEEKEFLKSLGASEGNLQDFAFNHLFVATPYDLAPLESNSQKCRRRKCKEKKSCGFVPNYPYIKFEKGLFSGKGSSARYPGPSNGWKKVEDIENIMRAMVYDPDYHLEEITQEELELAKEAATYAD
jgi:hypothetical protein